jgi:hypothetical protein
MGAGAEDRWCVGAKAGDRAFEPHRHPHSDQRIDVAPVEAARARACLVRPGCHLKQAHHAASARTRASEASADGGGGRDADQGPNAR